MFQLKQEAVAILVDEDEKATTGYLTETPEDSQHPKKRNGLNAFYSIAWEHIIAVKMIVA